MDGVTFRTFDGFDMTRAADGTLTGTAGANARYPGAEAYAKRLATAIMKFKQSHWTYRT